jgi:oxalate decarboxylase
VVESTTGVNLSNARMTIFMPVDNARTMKFHAEEGGFVPIVVPHYVENTGVTIW